MRSTQEQPDKHHLRGPHCADEFVASGADAASQRKTDVNVLQSAVQNLPVVRTEVVARVRERIRNGEYFTAAAAEKTAALFIANVDQTPTR